MGKIKIIPSQLKGEITPPPSKSISHRALICAGLSKGRSIISNIAMSEDIYATIDGLKALGVDINILHNNDSAYDTIAVEGKSTLKLNETNIDCRESGSTLRFLIPMALLSLGKVTFTGCGRLVERPLDIYYEIFKKQDIYYKNSNGKLPLTIKGILRPGEYRVKGNISSQFITGLMFALPLLEGDSKIIVTTKLESKGYIDLTIDTLKKFSIEIENNNYREFYIKGNQRYINRDFRVEGDFSQAAFYLAAGVIGDSIRCCDLDVKSLQGDRAIVDIIKAMGGDISIEQNSVITRKSQTFGITFDASQCPDLVPIVSVLGALSLGTTKIINAGRLRIKESDRLKSLALELNKLGGDVLELPEGLIINGKGKLKGGFVDSWGDHRIAMALSIASIGCIEPVILNNYEVVKKSYPKFYEDFAKLGGKVNELCMG